MGCTGYRVSISVKQVWKSAGQMVGAKEFMARAAIPLAEFIRQEGMEEELWFPLGRGEWTEIEGPVSVRDILLHYGLVAVQTCCNLCVPSAAEVLR